MTIKNYLLIAASAITMSACGGGDAPSQQEDCFPLVEYQKLISGGYFTPVPASWPSHWHWDGVWLTDPQGQFLPWGGAIAAHYGPYYEPGKPPAFVCKE